MNDKLIDASDINSLLKTDPESFFNDFNVSGSQSISMFEQWRVAVNLTNEAMTKYLVNCMQKQAPASFEGYNKYIQETIANQKKLSVSSKIATAATKVLSAAGVQFASTLLSTAFSSVLKWLDDYIHRADRAKEALQEFDSKIDDTRAVYKSHAELVNEAAKSYDALSAKVDTSTNLNLGLSEDEYAEFISLNNELAEAFPSLVKGYDESGNAILDFGNDCNTASEKLKNLLETEQQTMNMQIASELPELFKNTKLSMEDYDKQIQEFQAEIDNLNNKKILFDNINSGKLNLFEEQKTFSASDLGAEQYSQLYDLMSTSASEFIQTLSQTEKMNLGNLNFLHSDGQNIWLDLVSLSPDLQDRLKGIIQDNASTLSGSINDALSDAKNSLQTAESAKEASWSDFTQNLVSGMNSKASFQALSEEGQQLAAIFVQSLDSGVAKEMDDQDPYAYVRDNIISALDGLDENTLSELSKSINEYTNLDMSEMTITGQEEVKENLIHTINELFPKDKAEQFIISFGLNTETPTQEAYKSLTADLDAKYGEGWSESSKKQLNAQLDKLGINTEEEIQSFQKLFNETGKITDAYARYEEKFKNAADATNDLTNATEELSLVNTAAAIKELETGFDQLDSIYADMLNGEDFDYGNFLSNETFTATFGNLTDVTDEYKNAYSDFVETIANSNGKMTDETQDAFNKLATAYIEHQGILEDVTESTKATAIAQLEQMGVANAEEVVMTSMGMAFEDYAQAKRECAHAGVDLINATNAEINNLITEGKVSQETAMGLFIYQTQKALSNENGITTVEDCIQLENLANSAGYTGSALLYIGKIKGILNRIDKEQLTGLGLDSAMSEVAQYNKLLQQVISSEKKSTITVANYSGAAKSASVAQNNLAGATNDATDATQAQIDALEKEKEALEETKAEMEELHDAIVWFYDKQIDKIDEKIDAINEENEALEKQKEHMDTIIAAIESNYDTEIQAIQDKIDALKTSNDEEERALALEEAKRKLQEAKSRKTLQVYQKGTGFTYQVDTTAIKEAENELAELQENEVTEELEKQIDKLEEAKQKWSEIPQAYEKAMQEIAASNYFGANWASTTLFPSDKLLHSFQNNYTGIQSELDANKDRLEGYEVEKEAVENLKQLWDDAKNAYTYAEYEKKLQTFMGSDYEYELLSNSAVWREEYATKYAEICAQIESLEEQIKLASESTSTAVSNIGTAAQTSADQVNALNASLDAINGKKTESTHTHTNITRNITYSESSPYGWGNPYQSVTDHAKSNGNDYATYAKGGIITRKAAGNLDYIAKSLGEDHMIAVQEGEAVIPKESVKANESLVRDLINGNAVIDEDKFRENYAKLTGAFELNVLKLQTPDYEHLVSRQAGSKVVQFNGDIHVHEAQDADGLSKAIVTKLPMAMLQELNRRDF